MTSPDPDSWERIFETAQKVGGSTKQRPAKKTVQALQEETDRQRKRYAADVAVAMGAVDTGEDFDPYTAINEQYNAGGESNAQLKRTQDAIAAGLAQLRADVKANNNSGNSFIVSVAESGAVPSVFNLVRNDGAGSIAYFDGTLRFTNDTGREFFAYEEPLATDYFEVSLLVPHNSVDYLGSYGDRNIYFIGRGDATFDNFCFARLNGNEVRIGAVIDGVSTLDSPTWFGSAATISPDTYMTFRGGTISGVDRFQFAVNNETVMNRTDDLGVALYGEDYRWTALGLQHNALDVFNRSARISHFVANDNAPAQVVGSYGNMFRISTTQVGVSAGVNPLPTGFFDEQGEISPDIEIDVPNGIFTISESRPYVVSISSRTGTSWVNHFMWVLYRNGLPYRHFPMPDVMWGSNALGGTIKPDLVGASMTVHLYADDEISIGYEVDGLAGNILRGEAGATMTHFTITGVH